MMRRLPAEKEHAHSDGGARSYFNISFPDQWFVSNTAYRPAFDHGYTVDCPYIHDQFSRRYRTSVCSRTRRPDPGREAGYARVDAIPGSDRQGHDEHRAWTAGTDVSSSIHGQPRIFRR